MSIKGLCCNSGLLSEFNVFKAMEILVENDYQGIEICLEPNPPFYPIPRPHMSSNDSTEFRKKVRKHAKEIGINIPALNAHTNLIDGIPNNRDKNFKFIQGAIELAADLEVNIIITGGGSKNLYGFEDNYWSVLIESLNILLEYSKKLGVFIAIEAAGLPGNLIYNIEGMKKLFSKIDSQNIKVLFDPSHYFIRGDDVVKAFETFKDNVVHIHAKDAKGNYENFVFPPLGEGDINFQLLVQSINNSNYTGYISIEYESFAWGYENNVNNVLFNSKQFINKYI